VKVEIFVDDKLISESHLSNYYRNEFEEARNTLSSYVGIQLGEVKPDMDALLQAVYMITRHGWSVERVRREMWRR
jgi:hypothetical protein